MKLCYKYIHFERCEPTFPLRYDCKNNKDDTMLGWVEWYSPWRCYVFAAERSLMVFNSSCLRDIADFMDQIRKGRGIKEEDHDY